LPTPFLAKQNSRKTPKPTLLQSADRWQELSPYQAMRPLFLYSPDSLSNHYENRISLAALSLCQWYGKLKKEKRKKKVGQCRGGSGKKYKVEKVGRRTASRVLLISAILECTRLPLAPAHSRVLFLVNYFF